jgi:hypothetical protein
MKRLRDEVVAAVRVLAMIVQLKPSAPFFSKEEGNLTPEEIAVYLDISVMDLFDVLAHYTEDGSLTKRVVGGNVFYEPSEALRARIEPLL